MRILCPTISNPFVPLIESSGLAHSSRVGQSLWLLDDFADGSGAYGASAFADSETEALFHGDRGVQLDLQLYVVTRHHHFRAFRQLGGSGHVRGAEVKLGPVAVEERGVAAALFLAQNVNLALELGVRRNRTGLGQNHAALHVFLGNT